MSGSVTGSLIHAAAGILGALGRRVKRRGFAAQAAFSTAWRCVLDRGCGADVHRIGSVQSDPGMAVLVVVVGEEHVAECACVLEGSERAGKDRAVLEGLVVNTNAGGGVMALH